MSSTTTATSTTTMRAAVQRSYTGPEAIAVETMPRPAPAAGEVLVEVHAAGVDRGVWHLATGRPFVIRIFGFGFARPAQPVQGSDVAGVIVEVGEGVTGVGVGDRVYGTADGSYAQFATAKASQIAPMPVGMSFTDAAAAPVSGVTAQKAVVDAAEVKQGHRVLVLGAAGGVGSYAVQLAAAAGAEVTGVASGPKADFVRGLGATSVVDYSTTDVTAMDLEFDVIIVAGGLTSLRRLRRILSPEGTLVIVGGEGGGPIAGGAGRAVLAGMLSRFTSQRLIGLMAATTAEALDRLRDRFEAGVVRPAVTAAYPLERANDALADLAAGRIAGKAVVTVRDAA